MIETRQRTTFQKAKDLAQAEESNDTQLKRMSKTTEVNTVKKQEEEFESKVIQIPMTKANLFPRILHFAGITLM